MGSARAGRQFDCTRCFARGRSIIAGSAVIIGMLSTLSVPTLAEPDAGPIAVADGCSYKTLSSGIGTFGGGVTVNGHGYNFFMVTFTNKAAVAAKQIVFQIDFGKASRIVIPDVGMFVPGGTVHQTFRDRGSEMIFSARPTPNDGSVICTVLSAQFVDGTTYRAPLATAASPGP